MSVLEGRKVTIIEGTDIGLQFDDPWDATVDYGPGWIVNYQSVAYISIGNPTLGVVPTTANAGWIRLGSTGIDGSDGDYYLPLFTRAASEPRTAALADGTVAAGIYTNRRGLWFTEPPAETAPPTPVWVTLVRVHVDTNTFTPATWVLQFSGMAGPRGEAADAPQVQWSATGNAPWGDYSVGDTFLRISVDGGTTWLPTAAGINLRGPRGATGYPLKIQWRHPQVAWGDYAAGRYLIRFSVDDGTTWSPPNGFDLRGPQGNAAEPLRLQWSDDGNTWGVYEVGDTFARFSTDGGATWVPPAGINLRGPRGNAAYPTIIQWSANQSTWGSYTDGDAFIRFSTDNGATWMPSANGYNVKGPQGDAAPVPQVEWSSDQTRWGHYVIGDYFMRISMDGGTTWLPTAAGINLRGPKGDSSNVRGPKGDSQRIIWGRFPEGSQPSSPTGLGFNNGRITGLGAGNDGTSWDDDKPDPSGNNTVLWAQSVEINNANDTVHILDTPWPAQGEPGTAAEIRIEWSADGATWGAYSSGDFYIRISVDGGTTWTPSANGLNLRGPRGIRGFSEITVWSRNATRPAVPTALVFRQDTTLSIARAGGLTWHRDAYNATGTETLWKQLVLLDTSVNPPAETWLGSPVEGGEKGEKGDAADPVQVQWSADGTTWGNWTIGDYLIRFSVDGGTTWVPTAAGVNLRGPAGAAAAPTQIQWSDDGSRWGDYQDGDYLIRFSVDGGTTWVPASGFTLRGQRGLAGANGESNVELYRRGTTAPAAPASPIYDGTALTGLGNWTLTIPPTPVTQNLYAMTGRYQAGVVGFTLDPVVYLKGLGESGTAPHPPSTEAGRLTYGITDTSRNPIGTASQTPTHDFAVSTTFEWTVDVGTTTANNQYLYLQVPTDYSITSIVTALEGETLPEWTHVSAANRWLLRARRHSTRVRYTVTVRRDA